MKTVHLLLFALVLSLYCVSAKNLSDMRAKGGGGDDDAGFVLPASVSRIAALDFQGLYANITFARAINFYGGKALAGGSFDDQDWNYLRDLLEVSITLDPYLRDAYFLVEALLPWEAGLVDDANRLLQYGTRFRQGDWELSYFLGYNHYYFLKQPGAGAEFFMEASRKRGAPEYLPSLASRLAHEGGRTRIAIGFLKGMVAQAGDESLRAKLEKRLLALERAYALETMAGNFRKAYGRWPERPEELVKKGFISEIPPDPYGGDWKIGPNGQVESSSHFSEA